MQVANLTKTENIGAELETQGDVTDHDASTNGLINEFKKKAKLF